MTRVFLKEQDDTCTFRTFREIMSKARAKADKDAMPLKALINAGVILAMKQNKNQIVEILKKENLGGEI